MHVYEYMLKGARKHFHSLHKAHGCAIAGTTAGRAQMLHLCTTLTVIGS